MEYKRLSNDLPEFDTFAEVIEYSAEKYKDKAAFVYKDDKINSISFTDFRDDVSRMVAYLKDSGLSEQHIALMGANSYEYIVAFFGILCSGNIAVPICKDLNCEDLEVIISDCKPQFLIYLSGVRESMEDILKLCGHSCAADMKEVKSIVESGKKTAFDKQHDPEECCCVVYTSGTSGRPKGVMLSAKGILRNAVSITRNIDLADTIILCLPLHHMFACTTSMFMPVICGSTVVINLNGKKLLSDIAEFKPKDIFLVPAIAEFIYKRLRYLIKTDEEADKYTALINGSDINKKSFAQRREIFRKFTIDKGLLLQRIVSGAAMLDSLVVEFFEKIGIETLCGYGMTECSPVISVNMSGNNRYGSIGFPLDCNEVRIKSADGKGTGEIQVKGVNVMLGYYKMDKETAASFDEGWLRTGDIGYIDEDGYLFISGRIKNLMIRSSGENVSPEELETRISAVAKVSEVMVYEKNGLFIASIYAEGATEEDKDEIQSCISEINKTIPSYKRIDKTEFLDTCFEKTSTNKIKRRA